MREGYERVLTARLSDGWYLYNQDIKTKLETRINDLDRVTFFEGLGSVGDKARRIAALAKEIAPAVGADPEVAERAAMLAKTDLVTGMVKEFPELQGVMGRYYYLAQSASALRDAPDGAPQGEGSGSKLHPEEAQRAVSKDGEAHQIADAIRDHYKPAGQDDAVPTAPVSVAVALAEKIDTLTAFWAIDKKPTGSSDPFALRRAALGVIQIITQSSLRLQLSEVFLLHASAAVSSIGTATAESLDSIIRQYGRVKAVLAGGSSEEEVYTDYLRTKIQDGNSISIDLLSFFHDRLKVYLKEKSHRHDAIDAVRMGADGNLQDDLVLIVRRLDALEAFLKTDDGANLAAAYKRAANILKAEEKKPVREGAQTESAGFNLELMVEPEEKVFFAALVDAEVKAKKAVEEEDFEAAMTALASLRAPGDQFFDKVKVNDDNPALRANRLALLARFRAATAKVADFSKLEG
ncbi:MAG: glycine--tRNA ligase subunit beta [Alphaproteobacteria bacterium]|nr:glycine--tRNA ligase subunit beta [Alphaproteobacteria bacterium]